MRQALELQDIRLSQTNLALYREAMSRNFSDDDVQRIHESYMLCIQLFGQKFRADGRPFVTHLVGTASAALNYGQDLISNTDGAVAAILHAAYTQGEFGDSLPRRHPVHRQRVRAVTGHAAEELINSYADTPWPPLDHMEHNCVEEGFSAASLTMRQVFALKAVNELDDLLDFAPLYAGDAKRKSVEEGANFAVIAAGALGLSKLTDAIQRSIESLNQVEVPRQLRSDKNGAFVVTSVRLREQLRREVQAALARPLP